MAKRSYFTKEFKLEAVRLLDAGEKPASDLARELGIRRNLLYKWKEQLELHAENAFPGKGRPPSSDKQADEIKRLKQELKVSKEEVEILKKAAAFFAKEMK